MKLLRTVSVEIGKGLLAGLLGTVAMTLSSTLEMRIRGRRPSTAPADAASKVLQIVPRNRRARRRLGTLVHFAYGTAWGLARALLGAAGVRGRAVAPLAHFGAVWGTGLVMLPRTGVAPPVAEWGGPEIAMDALHHAVYVLAADSAYRALGRW